MEKEVVTRIAKNIKDVNAIDTSLLLEIQSQNMAHLMEFDEDDLLNITYLFQAIASNIGIKAGLINMERAEEFGNRLRQLVIDMTGIDPVEVLSNDEDYEETDKNED